MKARLWTPAILAVLGCLPTFGQSVISAQSGLIHYVEGDVFLSDQAVEPAFGRFPQLKEQEVLRSDEGRAEVLLSPGVFLRLGENSSFRMLSNRLTDARLELLSGSVVIEAAELEKDNAVTVVFKDAVVSLEKSGLYRLNSEPAELRVFAGRALVELPGGRIDVKKGKLLALDGTMAMRKFDTEDDTDSLDRWSRRRAGYLAMANVYAARSIWDSGVRWRRSGWGWNPYFGMFTFIPGSGIYRSVYGYRFWSPTQVYVVYDPPRRRTGTGGFGRYNPDLGYSTVPATSAGTSGAVAATSSAPSSSGGGSSASRAPRDSGRAGGRQR